MKTVWHWKNIVKFLSLIIGTSITWGISSMLLGIPVGIASAIGFFIGIVTSMVGMVLWELWHFE